MAKLDLLGELLLNWRIKIVLPHIRGRLLDLGCGTNKLVRKYGDGIGVDVYQFGDADIVLEDTSKIPFPTNSFDTISVIAALNHIPNREKVLLEMHRILKSDGQLILTMIPPAISKIWHLLRLPWDRDQKERGMGSGEVYGMTFEEILNLLSLSGFNIKSARNFMFGINKLIIAKKQQ